MAVSDELLRDFVYERRFIFTNGHFDEGGGGPFLEITCRPCKLIIKHFDNAVSYDIICANEGYSMKASIGRDDLAGLEEVYDFPEQLARTFTDRCYAEKAVHCRHMFDFLEEARAEAWKRNDFLTLALLSMGPMPPEPQVGPSLDPMPADDFLLSKRTESSTVPLAQPDVELSNPYLAWGRVQELYLLDEIRAAMKT